MVKANKYEIGTKYVTRGKHPRVCEVNTLKAMPVKEIMQILGVSYTTAWRVKNGLSGRYLDLIAKACLEGKMPPKRTIKEQRAIELIEGLSASDRACPIFDRLMEVLK